MIGGIWSQADNSFGKITIHGEQKDERENDSRLLTFDGLKIEGLPNNGNIQAVEFKCEAGDMAKVIITYYLENHPKIIMSEIFTINSMSLSFKPIGRETTKEWEEIRKKTMGLE